MWLKNAAPIKAVTAPGSANLIIVGLCTLSNFQCDVPEAAVVAISEKCMVAETIAGATPNVNSIDEEEAPKPIPSEPSINCARKPASANINSLFMRRTPSDSISLIQAFSSFQVAYFSLYMAELKPFSKSLLFGS